MQITRTIYSQRFQVKPIYLSYNYSNNLSLLFYRRWYIVHGRFMEWQWATCHFLLLVTPEHSSQYRATSGTTATPSSSWSERLWWCLSRSSARIEKPAFYFIDQKLQGASRKLIDYSLKILVIWLMNKNWTYLQREHRTLNRKTRDLSWRMQC